jgi:hypothetical protein
MTYILGWKNYSSVFLVGDSVITIEHPNTDGNRNTFRNQTTFGEDHIYEEGKTVSERWLKLYDLINRVILAISGDVEQAHEGINTFQICLDSDWDIEEAFEKSFSDRDVGIIAGYMEGDVPRLVSYNSMGTKGFLDHPFLKVVHCGSIDSSFEDQTEEFFSQIEENEWSEDQILASIISVAQSFCFQQNIISQGVGGFFSGIRVNKDGVNWQKDLAFIPFAYNGKEPETNQLAEIFGEARPVMTQVRESILFSCSSIIDDVKKARKDFSNFYPEKGVDLQFLKKQKSEWEAKWKISLNKNCDVLNAEFFIFYNIQKPIVAVVYSRNTKPFEIEDDKIKFKYLNINSFINEVFSAVDDEMTFIHAF